jgi:hypothetical protein
MGLYKIQINYKKKKLMSWMLMMERMKGGKNGQARLNDKNIKWR